MHECTYCGSDTDEHDPICVRDCDDHCSQVGRFCNWACLSAHIDEQGLETGAACRWQPG